MINVALLSRWHVHADDYAREAEANEQLNIVQVWDEDPERGELWADELGVPFEKDLDAVLSNTDIDAVIVTTPTSMHKEVIVGAAKHKKHIFTEKVLAFTIEDSKEILNTVEKNDVKMMVSLPRLTESDYLYANQAIEKGWLGELTMIRCRLAHNGGVVAGDAEQGWLPERFYDKEKTGGGSLIDLGAHPIYLTNRLAGPVQAVYARLQPQTSMDVDDSAAVIVEYNSGAIGIIETGFLSHGSPFQLELYGTEGTIMLKDGDASLNSIHVNNNQWVKLEENWEVTPTPMEQWVSAINSNTLPVITTEDVLNLTLVNQAAALSNSERKRVEIREFTK
ncbi:Gfo/Idh/MocA family protein [Oceanobacillus chungangensis]|uniref:Gfo/Idh/MocA family oxidoreductase n=1 Tax=Oceanobacillus chungangensis TaxID=1229152 RepID=A0A3D8PJR6_9BACI|nr:Gfo/Idh/MocA family oxidoreductase [Oceanobacillus chungangensis]RDW15425.1 gfo/Idh/MocA family oxidoreductase [Oceanobacillus chungangensis]